MNQEQAQQAIATHGDDMTDNEKIVIEVTFNRYRQALSELQDALNAITNNHESEVEQLRDTVNKRRDCYYYGRAMVAQQLVLRDMERQRKRRKAQRPDTQRMTLEAGVSHGGTCGLWEVM